MSKDYSNPLIKRYPPNSRFLSGEFKNQVEIEIRKDEFGNSVTDKESYRLSLAGKRGSVSNLGSSNPGWYMFPDGKYDHDKDFSHFYRKDLSIVEIDNYIKNMTEAQKNADEKLASDIQEQINLAKQARLKSEEKDSETKTE